MVKTIIAAVMFILPATIIAMVIKDMKPKRTKNILTKMEGMLMGGFSVALLWESMLLLFFCACHQYCNRELWSTIRRNIAIEYNEAAKNRKKKKYESPNRLSTILLDDWLPKTNPIQTVPIMPSPHWV